MLRFELGRVCGQGRFESFWGLEYRMTVIEISCLEVWKEISNYVDNDVEPELRARMEAHFKACAHCTAILDGTRNVVRLVGDGMEYKVPEGFSRRLYNRIKDK
jgi:anti-sigma factor RsiW